MFQIIYHILHLIKFNKKLSIKEFVKLFMNLKILLKFHHLMLKNLNNNNNNNKQMPKQSIIQILKIYQILK